MVIIMKDPFLIANNVLSIAWNRKIPVYPEKIIKKILVKDGNNEIQVKLFGNKSKEFTFNNMRLSSTCTYNENDGFFVCNYNIDDNLTRSRFAITHSLGHICLRHLKYNKVLYDSEFKNTDKKELDANIFASIILMPDDSIHNCIRELKCNNKNIIIQKISSLFSVSENAVKFRLKTMNLL